MLQAVKGMAAEAMCFGVRKPDAIVAWLLMCDGQPRNNRDYLLSADVTVGGMGLAEHPEQGSIATLTLLGLFATALNESKTVTCEGIPTKEFNEVLDAIPSEQIREMATEALAANKKVQVEYKVTEATLTIWTAEIATQKLTSKKLTALKARTSETMTRKTQLIL